MDNQNQEVPQITSNHQWLKTLGIGFGIVSFGIAIGVIGYILGTKNSQKALENQQSLVAPTAILTPTSIPDETANWKTFSSKSRGITLSYPATWIAFDDEFISEKEFVPGEQSRSEIYNSIEIQKYKEQIYVGYTNAEWLEKIDRLTEPLSEGKLKMTKIASGKIRGGERYVIVKNEPSATAQTEYFDQIRAYILKDQTLYQLTLNSYDVKGLEIFQQIIPTAIIN